MWSCLDKNKFSLKESLRLNPKLVRRWV